MTEDDGYFFAVQQMSVMPIETEILSKGLVMKATQLWIVDWRIPLNQLLLQMSLWNEWNSGLRLIVSITICRCRIGIESHCSCTEVDVALLKNASGRKRKALRLETREWNKVCDQIWTEAHHFIFSTSPSPLHREVEVKLFVSLLYASLHVTVSLGSVCWHIFLCNYSKVFQIQFLQSIKMEWSFHSSAGLCFLTWWSLR